MSRDDKRVEAMKQHPKSVRPEELEAVLLAAGFTFRQQGTSHRVYRRGAREILVVPQHRPYIKAAYVRDAIAILERGES
jgi:predicted RNA binding protein YcfA (HicA-like mRNA interferase family)